MRTGFLYEHVIGVLSACRGSGSFFSVWKIGLQWEWNVLKGAFVNLFGDFSDDMKERTKRKQKRALRNTDGGLCGANEADGGKITGMGAPDWIFDFTGIRVAAIFSVPTGFGAEYPILGGITEYKKSEGTFCHCSCLSFKIRNFARSHKREQTHE